MIFPFKSLIAAYCYPIKKIHIKILLKQQLRSTLIKPTYKGPIKGLSMKIAMKNKRNKYPYYPYH